MKLLRNMFHDLDNEDELDRVETEGIRLEGEGAMAHFAVEENPSTGFNWIIDHEACAGVMVLDEDFDAPTQIDDVEGMVVGAPGTK